MKNNNISKKIWQGNFPIKEDVMIAKILVAIQIIGKLGCKTCFFN